MWRRLGAKVTVVEFLDQLLPGMDGEVRKEAGKISKKSPYQLIVLHFLLGVAAYMELRLHEQTWCFQIHRHVVQARVINALGLHS